MIPTPRRTPCARRTSTLVVSAVLAAALAACSLGGGDSADARVRSPDPRFTDAEWDYGASVDPDAEGVTFQPDVVVPGGGAETVVQVTGDGLTWTLDGGADRVDQLEPGKVLFLTSRAVGRVLGVEEVDGDVAVTLGPVDITEVIRDIDTTFEVEVDPALIQVRAAPSRPASADATNPDALAAPGADPGDPAPAAGSDPPDPGAGAPGADGGGDDEGALASPIAGPRLLRAPGTRAQVPPVPSVPKELADRGVLPPVSPVPLPVVPVTGMRVFPLHGSDGSWGVELAHDRNGLKIRGSARVYLERPSVQAGLVIQDGRLLRAEATLRGVAGVRADFDATSERGLQANIHQIVDLPVDISMPVTGTSLPFSLNFHQSFKIDTSFTAQQSSLSFGGEYALAGSLGARYDNGSFSVTGPTGLSVKRSLLQSTSSVSLGVTAFNIAHKLRATVGIGGFGFVAGPYVALTSAMSVLDGSDLGLVKCRGANLVLDMTYGVGYVMPQPVVAFINLFLRALNLGQIEARGGTEVGKSRLATLQGYAPKVNVCRGAV